MSVDVEYLSNNNESEWRDFLEKEDRAGIWHTVEWRDILAKEYHFKPKYLMARKEGEVCGILPIFQIKSPITGNRVVSLPFSYHCGPVATSDEAYLALIDESQKISDDLGCKYVEMKMLNKLPDTVVNNGNLVENLYFNTSILDLSANPDDNWKKLDSRRTRWAINKAMRSEVQIRTETDSNDLKQHHKLKIQTRKKHGSPAPSLKFFKSIMDSFEDRGMVKLWVAEHENKVVSTLMFYTYKDVVMPAYIASDDAYSSLMPNNLLYWRSIEWGCNNGFKYFDFGRTEPNNESLLSFKSKWGCNNFKIPYYYYPEQPKLMSQNRNDAKTGFIRNTWKKLPDPVLEILGPKLLKHVG
ncbi:GNAT family N-acetyltransferase [Methanolobus psychrotolerans]|uniref:GNAT family N-acetyltransferase n=1 Tax=Methanolobus psychrotolerans TaxID=1874706 RepID=UPI000B91A409|nr:GNAT family N-acetyltransferase [Methanolobus psychrotolerans]